MIWVRKIHVLGLQIWSSVSIAISQPVHEIASQLWDLPVILQGSHFGRASPQTSQRWDLARDIVEKVVAIRFNLK